jgi:hypothetical protein
LRFRIAVQNTGHVVIAPQHGRRWPIPRGAVAWHQNIYRPDKRI